MKNTTNTLRALSASDLFGLWVAITAGNFVYQAFGAHSWMVAGERSFFQFVAMIAVFVMCKLKPNAEAVATASDTHPQT